MLKYSILFCLIVSVNQLKANVNDVSTDTIVQSYDEADIIKYAEQLINDPSVCSDYVVVLVKYDRDHADRYYNGTDYYVCWQSCDSLIHYTHFGNSDGFDHQDHWTSGGFDSLVTKGMSFVKNKNYSAQIPETHIISKAIMINRKARRIELFNQKSESFPKDHIASQIALWFMEFEKALTLK